MIGILGGGLAGLTVAAHCQQDCEVLEASDRVGGHCKSTVEQGYTFDEGPHIIFSKNKDTLNYMLSLLGDNVVQGRRHNKIYYKGQYVKYPFENGLYDLEPQDRFDCLEGFVRRGLTRGTQPPSNFKEWLPYIFGRGLAEKYLLPYNEKIWKCPANEMAFDWAAERLPIPKLVEIMQSACGISTEGYTHQLNFYYPKEGGIESLVKAMAIGVIVYPNFAVSSIRKVGSGWIVKDDGKRLQRGYEKIVSTLPLNEMVEIIDAPYVPLEIIKAAKELRFNSLITVTIGQDVYDTDLTALYVPDPKIIFHRLSFPINFTPSSKPGSIQAEITTNVDDVIWNMTDSELVERVVNDIQSMGHGMGPAIPLGKIVYSKVQRLKYGYPVPTFAYREDLRKVRHYFESQGIVLCGRNAEFEYINMDQCIEHGIAAAEKLQL